jgi:hypothetical protein
LRESHYHDSYLILSRVGFAERSVEPNRVGDGASDESLAEAVPAETEVR